MITHAQEPAVTTGLESFIMWPCASVFKKRIGLLCNSASVDRRFHHARDLINDHFPGCLAALYSPQHGFFAEKQDNMIESGDIIDPVLNIPVFSLYGKTRTPTEKMFDLIDTLVIDLLDVGTRVYTFIYTVSYCLEAAKKFGKNVIVLDRPNPVGGISVEGNLLSDACVSFVGRYPIPMRHGLTMGELCLLFNDVFDIGCNLEIVPMKGWKRSFFYKNTGLPWIPPSPNLPTPESAMVYPGQVIWEGTNISEGRGTTKPFEMFGAPFMDTDKILSTLNGSMPDGIVLRPVFFEPTSNKWAGQVCKGFHIHVLDPCAYQPYMTSLLLLQAVLKNHKDRFQWKQPPYEYEYDKLPIDLILGDVNIRQRIENLDPLDAIAASWENDLKRFIKTSRKYHLYH